MHSNPNDDRDNLTIDKFKAFIDSLDAPATPAIKIDTSTLNVDAYEAASEAMRKANETLGVLISDKTTLPPHIVDIARVQMHAALVNAKPELAQYISMISDDAKELMFIEHMRRMYGDDMIDAAINDARNSPRTIYHSLQLRIMAQQLSTSFDQVHRAFVQLGGALVQSLARGFADVQSEAPANRYERRSAKHKRRKTESDQLWARKNNPKRRR